MVERLKYVVLGTSMFILALLALISFSDTASAYSQSGPTTVCTTAQMTNMSIELHDAPFSTITAGSSRYWFHSEHWGDRFQKFAGTLAAPCGTAVWEKTKAQLFTNSGSIDGQPWIMSTYKDTNGLLAFIHIERAGANQQKGRIGLAWSTNNGDTFTYLGNILSSYGDHNMTAGGFMQGAPYFIKDGYFYVYYTDNNDYYGYFRRIAVARASVADVLSAAQNGTTTAWKKYYNGAWNEAGLGGNFTPISNATGISHSSAAYSTYTGKYYLATTVMAWDGSQSPTWVKLWESTDGVNWTLTKTVAEDIGENIAPNSGYQYVTIVDGSGGSNGTVGQNFYLYSGYRPYDADKIIRRWSINLAGGAAPPPPTPPSPTPPNPSYNNTYSSSSNWNGNRTADKAFDGLINTDWSAAAGSNYNGQWLQVDFGTEISFNRAEISEYSNQTKEYRIEYWNGSSWLAAYTGTNLAAWPKLKTVTFPAVKGSKARLYFVSGTNVPIIYEFKLSYAVSTSNHAIDKTYSSSSNWDANQTADKAFDENLSTNWRAASGSYNGQWLQVNFGSNKTFNKVVLNEYGSQTTGFRIEYWNGSSWLTAYTGTTIGPKNQFKTITFPAVTGSKARIYFTSGTGQPIIYEFEIFHETITPSLKVYSSSSKFNEARTAYRAFDGNLNTDWSAASGSNYNGQWLQVDYGANVTFNKAVITEYPNQTTGYRIEYWNGSKWLTAYTGTTLGAWPNPQTVTFPAVTGSKARLYFTSGTNIPIIYEFELHNQ